MVVLSHVQISSLFFLQKHRVHIRSLLVRVFLRIQCTGKQLRFSYFGQFKNAIFQSFQTVFDPMYISIYNLFYTSLPVLALGLFEQDVSDKDSIEYPKLYTPGLTNSLFNVKEFMRSVMHGLFSSLVIFLLPYGTYRDGIGPDGHTLSDHMTLASVMAAILILDNTAQVQSTCDSKRFNDFDNVNSLNTFRLLSTQHIGP